MKIITFFLFLGCLQPLLAQTSTNMTQLSHWDDETLPLASPGNLNLQYSGCWGMALNGREYAIVGGARHVLIFDVSDPTEPNLIAKYAGQVNTVWREFKSYKDRFYAVSDATQEGLMIFDMSAAPDTVYRTYFSNALFNAAHTITLDTMSGHIYLNGGSSGNGITVLDVSQNLDQPTLLSQVALPGGYIHDSYVRNDTLYASSGYNGYWIYDFKTDITQPQALANTATGGYNHNSWLTADGRYAYYTEEIPEARPIQIVDLQNLTTLGQIEVVGDFLDHFTPGGFGAIPHNVYISGNLLFDSQYEDGLVVYDISTPTAPVLVGHFDTHPENTQYNSYYGNWGNYPWLPSGTIIAVDMQNGLSLLSLDNAPSEVQSRPDEATAIVKISPNPATDQVGVRIEGERQIQKCILRTANGSAVASANVNADRVSLETGRLPRGIYFLELTTDDGERHIEKIVLN